MNFKKGIFFPLILVLGGSAILVSLFIVGLIFKKNLIFLKAQASPGTCTVSDDLVVTGTIGLDNNKNLMAKDTGGTYRNLIGLGSDNNTYLNIVTGANRNLYIWDAETSMARMAIQDNGNVGIGITNPGYKLDISNTTGAGGLRVNTNYSAFINRGIYGIASGGTLLNYGGQFSGSNGSFNTGVYSSASGPADSVNYALYSSAFGGIENWGLYVAAGNAYFAGDTEITGNLTVTGKTNISYPLNPWSTVDCTNFDAGNETCNFTPDTNYSAVMIGIAADVESDTLAIGFFDAAGGGGNEIGRLYMGSAVCEAAIGSFYRPAHSTVLLPTSVKSAKILSIGGCTRATSLTNNIIIMGYFR